MHMVIRVIVYAEDEDEGLEKAREILDGLTIPWKVDITDYANNNSPFDYYCLFDGSGGEVAGKGRWGKLPLITRVDSREGKELVKEGMEATLREFNEDMDRIRTIVENFSNEEIFEDRMSKEDVERFDEQHIFSLKFPFSNIYTSRGPGCWLYDNDGSAIGSRHHLEDVLNKWKDLYLNLETNPYEGLDIWVVPADVHF